MKNITIKVIFIALQVALFSSCGKPLPSELIDHAEVAISEGDIDTARKYCDALSDTATIKLTPSLLCRQALVYARLSEMCDNTDDMYAAAKCIDAAYSASPDSVELFTQSLSPEEKSMFNMVKDVQKVMSSPADFSDFEDEDTIIENPDTIIDTAI